MIKCEECHGNFRRKVNRRNTSFSTYPSVSTVDAYFKEASEIWLRIMVRDREENDIARNDLRQLEVKNKELTLSCTGDQFIAELPDDYYSSLNFSILAAKEGCEECGKTLVPRMVQSDDLQETLKDPFRKPSYEYEEVIVDEVANSLVLYTNGEFNIEKVLANYYRKITPMACPELAEQRFYISPTGDKVDKNVDFELDSTYAYNDITDIAVLLFLRDVSDNVEFDTQLKKISVKYKLNQ